MILFVVGVVALIAGVAVTVAAKKAKQPSDSWGKQELKKKKLAGVIAIVVAAVLICTSFFATIPTGYTGILTTFGRINDTTLEAGLNAKAPWQAIALMDNREQTMEFRFLAFSSDMQEVSVSGKISFAIDKAAAMNLYRSVGKDYYQVLVPHRLEESGRVLISGRTAEELIANREMLAPELLASIRTMVEPYGLNIISVSLDIDFADSFTDAIEAKQVATQVFQRTQTEQQQETMIAEQNAARQVIEAEAAAAVAQIDADAEAYAIRTRADAEAAANAQLAASITADLISYMEATRWNGTLPSTYIGDDSGALPVINVQ